VTDSRIRSLNRAARRAGRLDPRRSWHRWRRSPVAIEPPRQLAHWCCLCGWRGRAFDGTEHCESALCPRCGSIARDRFLLYCFMSRTGPRPRSTRVLETSPRLDRRYRQHMGRWFDYVSSDYDERSHVAQLRLDLQHTGLPDGSFDVILSAHVLEHVPNTLRCLRELHRILAPGGRLYLQVPLLQHPTAAPLVPEFHGDDTPVHWRFGWDLREQLDGAGFTTTALVPAGFTQTPHDTGTRGEFAVTDLIRAAPAASLVEVGSPDLTRRIGWHPAYMFVVFEAVRRPTD
jgi:SAM-dependent methyltransferase